MERRIGLAVRLVTSCSARLTGPSVGDGAHQLPTPDLGVHHARHLALLDGASPRLPGRQWFGGQVACCHGFQAWISAACRGLRLGAPLRCHAMPEWFALQARCQPPRTTGSNRGHAPRKSSQAGGESPSLGGASRRFTLDLAETRCNEVPSLGPLVCGPISVSHLRRQQRRHRPWR